MKKIMLFVFAFLFLISLVSASWSDELNNNLISYWNMESTDGENVTDTTGTGHDLYGNSSMNYKSGLIGNSANFSGGYLNTSASDFDFGDSEFTVNFWVNASETDKVYQIIGTLGTGNAGWGFVTTDPDGDLFYISSTNQIKMVVAGQGLTANGWDMITIRRNSTNMSLWYNGNEVQVNRTYTVNSGNPLVVGATGDKSQAFDGELDEIGIWNRSLTDSEITQLYNSGSGLEYDGVNVTLNNPTNNTLKFLGSTINFNCSAKSKYSNIDNITLYIDGVSNYTFSDGTSNYSELYYSMDTYDFGGAGNHNWTCISYNNQSQYNLQIGNFTFNISYLSENSQDYNVTTYETSSEDFVINISYDSSVYTLSSAELFYNGTGYLGSKEGTGNTILFRRNIDVPTITDTINMSFYWQIALTNSTGTYHFNSTIQNQTVSNVSFGSCGGGSNVIVLNFTALDEENLSRISGYDFKGTFEYYIGGSSIMKNVSIDSSDIMEQTLCINYNTTYYLTGIVEYTANYTSYVTRNYYFENYSINNVTQNISLYLLNSSDSTSFILEVVDQNQQSVEGALVYTQRYYPGTGEYKTVQIAKTDENGKSIGFFKTETVDYRFLIERDTETELITSKQKVVPEDTPYTLTFTIGAALDSPWIDFDDLDNLEYSLYHNTTTNITHFEYTDASGNFEQGRLLVKEVMNNQSDIVICNVTSTSSSASLTCDLSSLSGNFVAYGMITRSGTESTISVIWTAITTIVEIIGKEGLFLAFFIILTAGCAFFWHPIAGIIGINVSVIFVNMIGLVDWSALYIFGMIAISIILIWTIKD